MDRQHIAKLRASLVESLAGDEWVREDMLDDIYPYCLGELLVLADAALRIRMAYVELGALGALLSMARLNDTVTSVMRDLDDFEEAARPDQGIVPIGSSEGGAKP